MSYLPANQCIYLYIEAFTISEGLMMVRAISIKQQVFEELRPLFNYSNRYLMGIVGPQGFTVYSHYHRTNDFVESFYASLLELFGIHPPLWTFYGKLFFSTIFNNMIVNIKLSLDLIRSCENITRLELIRNLNGQQVC